MDSATLDSELELPDLTRLSIDLGDGLVLRNFRAEDADSVYQRVISNSEHLHFMDWLTPEYSERSAREFIGSSIKSAAECESLSLGIFSDDEFIGSIGFVHFDKKSRRTEIGYWLDKGFEGKGIASKACSRLIDLAFDELKMNRVEIRCVADNNRSAAVPQRLGFKQEAYLREHEIRDGKLNDYLVFGILRSEWSKK